MAEVVDQEGVQVVEVAHGDLDQEVLVAAQDEDGGDLGQVDQSGLERLDDVAPQRADPGRDERRDTAVEGCRIDLGVIAADDVAATDFVGLVLGGPRGPVTKLTKQLALLS